MIRPADNLRVLMIADIYPPAICGIGDYSAKLAAALADRGVEVHVLTKAIDGAPADEELDGVTVHRLARQWKLADMQPILRATGEMGPGTIVHVQYPSLTGYERRPMINLLPAMFRAFKRQFPLVVTMHGFHEHRVRWRMRAVPMLWASSASIFVHRRDQTLASRWAPPSRKRSTMIPIASNVEAMPIDAAKRSQVRRELEFADDDCVAVYFGEVRPDKGLHLLLSAVETCRAKKQPAKALVISTVGTHKHQLTPYEHEMLARLDQGKRNGWSKLARAETSQRAAQLLQAADIAVFPFTLGAAENRGSLLAAVVNGVPVLTTRGVSTPPGFEDDFGVETAPADDQNALASRLSEYVESPAARATLAQKSRATASRFSWDNIADQTIEVYRKCLAL